jgi:hypothetical protein
MRFCRPCTQSAWCLATVRSEALSFDLVVYICQANVRSMSCCCCTLLHFRALVPQPRGSTVPKTEFVSDSVADWLRAWALEFDGLC